MAKVYILLFNVCSQRMQESGDRCDGQAKVATNGTCVCVYVTSLRLVARARTVTRVS